MARADSVSGSDGQHRGQPGGGQSRRHGVQCHGGGVVILAQMRQHDLPGALLCQRHGEGRGVLVAQMSLCSQNPLLQIVGIRAGAEGLHVVIGLQNGQIHAGQQVSRFLGDVSRVSQEAHAAVAGIQPPAAGAGGVVGGDSQRSSIESCKNMIANQVASVFKLAGAIVTHGDGYPGWAPNPDSKILKVAQDTYKRLFNKDAKIMAIHAGLECGLFLEKYPNLDMISFGPTLRDVHSPNERIEIKTVGLWWAHLLELLKSVPAK